MSDRETVSEAEIQAWADGRLEASRCADVESWFAAHPEEAERAAAYRSLNEELRARYDAVLQESVPTRMERTTWRGSRLRAMARAAGWAVLGVAIGAVGGWQLRAVHAPAPVAQPEMPPIVRRGAQTRSSTWSPGYPSGSAARCARPGSMARAWPWSAAACCRAKPVRWRSSCISARAGAV
jgi:anti-sigma factor RsiW